MRTFAMVAALLAALLTPGQGDAATGVLLGAAPEAIDGFRQDGVAEIEDQLGRKLDLVRVFETWDSNFPSAFHSEMIDGGRLMALSIRPKRDNGSIIPWADIAAAQPGTALHNDMVEWADRLRAVEDEVWFTFHHEPEATGSKPYGDAAEFVAAWRTFVDVFRDRDAGNVRFAWVMTHWSFEAPAGDSRNADHWYPGDSYVDIIGSDAYNWDKCRDSATDTWRSFADTVAPQRAFGEEHPDKDLFLAELASTERPGQWGTAKASWIEDAATTLQQPGWDQFVAVSFFDVSDAGYPNCHWPIDSSDAALEALRVMGSDPYFGGVAPPRYTDVPAGSLFFDDIEWLADTGITRGCNPPVNDRFCPDDVLTRGQMAAFLVRALGYTDNGGGNHFIDDNGSVFEDSTDKLATAGITRGCNPPVNDRFCPDDVLTRDQMAAFLVRALGYTDNGGGNHFVDDNGSVFEDSIDKLATAGITRGCNPPVNDRFCPNATVTRAEMAAFLYRALS